VKLASLLHHHVESLLEPLRIVLLKVVPRLLIYVIDVPILILLIVLVQQLRSPFFGSELDLLLLMSHLQCLLLDLLLKLPQLTLDRRCFCCQLSFDLFFELYLVSAGLPAVSLPFLVLLDQLAMFVLPLELVHESIHI